MIRTFRTLLLTVIAVAAIAPSTALAQDTASNHCGMDYSRNSVDGHYCDPVNTATASAASMSCGKDYSRNSVDGGYCVSSVSSPIVSAAPRTSTPGTNDGFSWGSAAAGAGAALLLIAGAFGLTAVVRRRHGSSRVGGEQPAVTG